MQLRTKRVLLLGAVLTTGISAAIAQMNSQSGPGPRRDYPSGRAASHFLGDFDLNHDGRVTKDEFNRALGQRFASVAHGQPINGAQFAADAAKRYRDREAKFFRRADWNGDGKLSLEEYVAPLRARFSYSDRNSTGVVDCAHRAKPNNNFGDANRANGKTRRHGQSSRGLCFTSDLNQDGKVTHSEFDTANAKKFAELAHGGKTLTFDQFAGAGSSRYQGVSGRIFQRLDANSDGKLTMAEYAVPQQKQFARFDKNHDGVVTREEVAAASRSGNDRNGRPYKRSSVQG